MTGHVVDCIRYFASDLGDSGVPVLLDDPPAHQPIQQFSDVDVNGDILLLQTKNNHSKYTCVVNNVFMIVSYIHLQFGYLM